MHICRSSPCCVVSQRTGWQKTFASFGWSPPWLRPRCWNGRSRQRRWRHWSRTGICCKTADKARSKVRSSSGSFGQLQHWSKVLKVMVLNPTHGGLPSCRDCNSELDQSQDSGSMQRGGTELNPAGREGCFPAHVRISSGCQTPFLQSLASTPDPANRVLWKLCLGTKLFRSRVWKRLRKRIDLHCFFDFGILACFYVKVNILPPPA